MTQYTDDRAGLPAPAMPLGSWKHVHLRGSWQAIFAGVVLVLAVQVLLSLLGLLGAGVGLNTVNTNVGSTSDTPDPITKEPKA